MKTLLKQLIINLQAYFRYNKCTSCGQRRKDLHLVYINRKNMLKAETICQDCMDKELKSRAAWF